VVLSPAEAPASEPSKSSFGHNLQRPPTVTPWPLSLRACRGPHQFPDQRAGNAQHRRTTSSADLCSSATMNQADFLIWDERRFGLSGSDGLRALHGNCSLQETAPRGRAIRGLLSPVAESHPSVPPPAPRLVEHPHRGGGAIELKAKYLRLRIAYRYSARDDWRPCGGAA